MSTNVTNILLEAGTNELEIVEFYLEEPQGVGEESYKGYYGVNVAKVLEIIRMPKITEMPQVSHPSVLGAFNLRNQIIPLVDLGQWLKKEHGDKEPPKVIVGEFNNVTTAFLVSGVTRIHRISWEEVEAPNRYMSSLASNSITGWCLEGRIIFILDLEKIVAELNPAGTALRRERQLGGGTHPRPRRRLHPHPRDDRRPAARPTSRWKDRHGGECWDACNTSRSRRGREQAMTDYVRWSSRTSRCR
jgi:two-component system chemotaxis response regulator CheV